MTLYLSRFESQGRSPLHRFDPRVKVVTAILLIIGILATPAYRWVAYPLIWTLIGSLAAFAHIRAWQLARWGGVVLPFTLAAAVLLVTTPGQPIIEVASLTVTDAGLAHFLAILLKSWLAVQVTLLLTRTTPFMDLLGALEQLGVSKTLLTILSFLYRYLFTLKDEAERLLRARAARSGAPDGLKTGGSLLWRTRVTGGMVGNLFLRSYERSERVYQAMLARGYDGQPRYTQSPPLNLGAVMVGAIPVVGMILIQIYARFAW